jgi:hypothetical protein
MMSAYSEDLRRRIFSSGEAGMQKAQAARTFSVSLSSVKRYVQKDPFLSEHEATRRDALHRLEACSPSCLEG